MPHKNQDIQTCIELCQDCRTECEETLYGFCLPTGEKHAEARHVRLMTDCIEICQTAADFMTRDSDLHASICAACADVCEACAISCERMGGKEMAHCAQICRRCAESCRVMGKMRNAA